MGNLGTDSGCNMSYLGLCSLSYFLAGLFSGDLLMFDPSNNSWKDLSGTIYGAWPSPRASHGFASAGDKLFIFGGDSSTGLQLRGGGRGKSHIFYIKMCLLFKVFSAESGYDQIIFKSTLITKVHCF